MCRRDHLAQLRQAAPVILPSLLLCDFGNLEREVQRLETAGVGGLHLDVMDGNFVPNLTYGMPIVAGLRGRTDLALDVHLMIERPERYITPFFEAGADLITIHVEAAAEPRSVLRQIRELGAGAGIALNPETPLERIAGCLDLCDLVLVMSVPAGFGGQAFHKVALEKLGRLREMLDDDVLLEVDGGINEATIRACAEAGAQLFVVGSAIFQQPEYLPVVRKLTELCSI
jgi:ribulose-phosphate 3-epimerase